MSARIDIGASTFLPYQWRWILDRSAVKVGEKSRRIGLTWATAYEACEVAALDPSHGGSNFWYQTYAEDDAKEFIEDAAKFARGLELLHHKEEEILSLEEAEEYFILPEGERSIKITSVRFSSGNKITALPHSPRKLRGKGGVYCFDEAAYHEDVKAVLKAAEAFRVWGGRVIVISTHDGVDNEFNVLCEAIRAGSKRNHSLHKVTLLDAVKEGLYKRICQVRGAQWSKESEDEWVEELLETEGAEEEFLCIPSRSGGKYLSQAIIEACMVEEYPIVRLELDDEFLHKSAEDKEEFIEAWCLSNLLPLCGKLPEDFPHYLGEDFGRSADMTVFAPAYEDQQLDLHIPFLVELGNVPFAQQRQVFDFLTENLPRLTFVALDGTGNGAELGEHAVAKYGEEMAESCKLSEPWYAMNLPNMKARFQSGEIHIPKDLDVRQDLTMFEVINGVPKLPRIRIDSVRKSKGKTKRHGDAGVAIALACYAAKRPAMDYEYESVPKSRGLFARKGIW